VPIGRQWPESPGLVTIERIAPAEENKGTTLMQRTEMVGDTV